MYQFQTMENLTHFKVEIEKRVVNFNLQYKRPMKGLLYYSY